MADMTIESEGLEGGEMIRFHIEKDFADGRPSWRGEMVLPREDLRTIRDELNRWLISESELEFRLTVVRRDEILYSDRDGVDTSEYPVSAKKMRAWLEEIGLL